MFVVAFRFFPFSSGASECHALAFQSNPRVHLSAPSDPYPIAPNH